MSLATARSEPYLRVAVKRTFVQTLTVVLPAK